MKMEQTECSETSAYKIQTPGIYPEENIHHTEHGESLKFLSFVSMPFKVFEGRKINICHLKYLFRQPFFRSFDFAAA
jgi:hypothetical protein